MPLSMPRLLQLAAQLDWQLNYSTFYVKLASALPISCLTCLLLPNIVSFPFMINLLPTCLLMHPLHKSVVTVDQ